MKNLKWLRVGDGFWVGVLLGIAIILAVASRFVELKP